MLGVSCLLGQLIHLPLPFSSIYSCGLNFVYATIIGMLLRQSPYTYRSFFLECSFPTSWNLWGNLGSKLNWSLSSSVASSERPSFFSTSNTFCPWSSLPLHSFSSLRSTFLKQHNLAFYHSFPSIRIKFHKVRHLNLFHLLLYIQLVVHVLTSSRFSHTHIQTYHAHKIEGNEWMNLQFTQDVDFS